MPTPLFQILLFMYDVFGVSSYSSRCKAKDACIDWDENHCNFIIHKHKEKSYNNTNDIKKLKSRKRKICVLRFLS